MMTACCYSLVADKQPLLTVDSDVPANWPWKPRLNARWLARRARIAIANFVSNRASQPDQNFKFELN